jgi:hypothetical protein
VATLIADLPRALLGALAAGVLPGYFWAGFVRRSDGIAERLAYSAALSMAMVPATALLLAWILGSGVTLWLAVASVAVVAGSGALAVRLKGAAGGPAGPALPRPGAIRDGRVLALILAAVALVLATELGLPAPGWLLIIILAALVIAGLLARAGAGPAASRGAAANPGAPARPGPAADREAAAGLSPAGRRDLALSPAVRAPALATVLALTAVRGYWGVARDDWPYLRGMDQFSHAVMAEQTLAHGSYGSYLVYPPGYSAVTAVICRLTGLQPLSLFPALTPALLLLTAIGAYALATRLWGWEFGLAAAALSGLVLVGPYASFGGGLYPNLVSAFFLMVMFVAALITLSQSPSARSGFLVAVVGASVVLYHSVASLYLVLLLAIVTVTCLPYLLLRGGQQGRALARALTLSLAALGALAVAYAWHIYSLGRFLSDDTTARATVALDVGSQSVLRAGDLLAWVGSPVVWLGVLGFVALAGAIRFLDRPEQVVAALTVLLWCAMMYLGSRTAVDGFPQRFERDVGAPLTALAALAAGMIAQSLALVRRPGRPVTALAAAAAAVGLVVIAGTQAIGNMVTDLEPSREVLTQPVAEAGGWLARHNTGGTIISTPDMNRGITNRAVLALGGYTGLQSYPLARIRHPRSLPTAGIRPVLDSRWVLLRPATCHATDIIDADQVRYVVLYRFGTEANYAGFRTDPARYRRVFENSSVVIYAPRPLASRSCSRPASTQVPAAGRPEISGGR